MIIKKKKKKKKDIYAIKKQRKDRKNKRDKYVQLFRNVIKSNNNSIWNPSNDIIFKNMDTDDWFNFDIHTGNRKNKIKLNEAFTRKNKDNSELIASKKIIMILSSYSMIKGKCENCDKETETVSYNIPLILLEGIVVGFVTGLVGAGGGFLIIPALVMLAKLPMKRAVATSLLIISIKSLIGFIGDVENLKIDWDFLLIFTGFSIAGMFLGVYLNKFIKGEKLKKGFGWFVLLMGIYVLYKELTR